jgi:MFS transporter, DHA1 family, tetracycline resistance protein
MSSSFRGPMAFIFVTLVLDVLAIGLIIPVLPALVQELAGGNTEHAVWVYGAIATAGAAMQFFCSPILGALSDRFGRRPILLISMLGMGLDYVFMAWAPSIAWLFLGRIISGACSASIATAFAYVSDITPPQERAQRFGLLGAAFGLGFVAGPALGGVLGAMDPRLPFWLAAALSLVNAAWGYFILPESLPVEKRDSFRWAKANPIGALVLLRSHSGLLGLSTVRFLSHLAHVSLPTVAVLYMGYRYEWDAKDVGLVLALVGICSMVVQGGLMRPIISRIGEWRALSLGLVFGCLGFAGYGLAAAGWEFIAAVPLMALWGLAGPSADALMSQRVGAQDQGKLQGATASLSALAQLIGPAIFSTAMATTLHSLPGTPFYVASALLVAALVLAQQLRGREAPQDKSI